MNQIEIYFPLFQRKVLTSNDFGTLAELEERLLTFQQRHEKTATLSVAFTRQDLVEVMAKLKKEAAAD